MTESSDSNQAASSSNTKNAAPSTKADKGDSLMMVAIVDQTVAATDKSNNGGPNREIYRPVRLPSPSQLNEEQDYLLLTTTTTNNSSSTSNNNTKKQQCQHLMEIQSLDSDNPTAATAKQQQYNSWMVGNSVIGDGKLYTVSRIDPLFWILAGLNPSALAATNNKQWQPLDQLLASVPESVQAALDRTQMQHLAATYDMGDGDDDELFYKYTLPKIMQWLSAKQASVEKVLQQQLLQDQGRQEASSSQVGQGGAFCAGFSLTSGSEVTAPTEDGSSSNDAKETSPKPLSAASKVQAKHESIQVICSYLSDAWRTAFLEQSKVNATAALQDPNVEEQRLAEAEQKRIRLESPGTNPYGAAAAVAVTPVAPPKPKLSFGQKQLLKVNKKGMKPMTSFFAAKKPSK